MSATEPTPAEIQALLKSHPVLITEANAINFWKLEHGIALPIDPQTPTLKILGMESKDLGGYPAICLNVDKPVMDTGYNNFAFFTDKKGNNKANAFSIGKTYDVHFEKNQKGRWNAVSWVEVNPADKKAESVQKTNADIVPADSFKEAYKDPAPPAPGLPKKELWAMDKNELIETQKSMQEGAIRGQVTNLIVQSDIYHVMNNIDRGITKLAEKLELNTKSLNQLITEVQTQVAATKGSELRIKEQMDVIKGDLMKAIEKNQAKGKKGDEKQ